MDAILLVIMGTFMCVFGGFGTYGCYRCVKDEDPRFSSEDSLMKQRMYRMRHNKNRKVWPRFCSRRKSRSTASSSSLSSFNGTIYTVHSFSGDSNFSRENDGKVPFDLLQQYDSRPVLQNTFINEVKRGRAISTAPF